MRNVFQTALNWLFFFKLQTCPQTLSVIRLSCTSFAEHFGWIEKFSSKNLKFLSHFVEARRLPKYWGPISLRLVPPQRLCSLYGSVASAYRTQRGWSGGSYRTPASGTGGWYVGCVRASGSEKGNLCRGSASKFPDIYRSREGFETPPWANNCKYWLTETRNIWWSSWRSLLISALLQCRKWAWLGITRAFKRIKDKEKFSGDPAIGSRPKDSATVTISRRDRNL